MFLTYEQEVRSRRLLLEREARLVVERDHSLSFDDLVAEVGERRDGMFDANVVMDWLGY